MAYQQTSIWFLALATRVSNNLRLAIRSSLLKLSTRCARSMKRKASSPNRIGVSLMGRAIILGLIFNFAAKVQNIRHICKFISHFYTQQSLESLFSAKIIALRTCGGEGCWPLGRRRRKVGRRGVGRKGRHPIGRGGKA